MKERNLTRFNEINQRCFSYYYEKICSGSRNEWDFSRLFYFLGDQFIKVSYFQGRMDSMYFEAVDEHNFSEVRDFFETRKKMNTHSDARFYDRENQTDIQFYVEKEHNKKELELFNADDILQIGYESAKLLKNQCGETLGISVYIPIHKGTLDYLKNKPVSRAYFRSLTHEQLEEYDVPENHCAGWFVRMMDFLDPIDAVARSYMLNSMFSLLQCNGRIVISTPIRFYLDLLTRFGFEEVPGVVHFDYGKHMPSPTYILDVRGSRLTEYLQKLAEPVVMNHKLNVLKERFSFTKREMDIVKFILKEYTNQQIAKALSIKEVTVKKHVSSILKKAGAKNRSQLVKRVYQNS